MADLLNDYKKLEKEMIRFYRKTLTEEEVIKCMFLKLNKNEVEILTDFMDVYKQKLKYYENLSETVLYLQTEMYNLRNQLNRDSETIDNIEFLTKKIYGNTLPEETEED